MPNCVIPDSDKLPQPDNAAPLAEKHGAEIHSAKAHRCVDKVQSKGHGEGSAWAICTSSIGKSGTYSKGHGGKAAPKRKVHETKVSVQDALGFDDILGQERERVTREYNQCHRPSGAGGGEFCAGSGKSLDYRTGIESLDRRAGARRGFAPLGGPIVKGSISRSRSRGGGKSLDYRTGIESLDRRRSRKR